MMRIRKDTEREKLVSSGGKEKPKSKKAEANLLAKLN